MQRIRSLCRESSSQLVVTSTSILSLAKEYQADQLASLKQELLQLVYGNQAATSLVRSSGLIEFHLLKAGKLKTSMVFYMGTQTNEFLKVKIGPVCLPNSENCGRPCRSLPHVKRWVVIVLTAVW